MFRSLQNNLAHENDYQSLKPTYQTQHELSSILNSAITDSIGTNAKNQRNDTETLRIDNRYRVIGSEHYEDILATATLNKVLEICESAHQEERERERVDIGGGSLEHGGTDTDSGLSGSIVGEAHKRVGKNFSEGVSEGSSSPLCESPKEGFSLPESSKNRSSPPMVAASPDIGVVLDTTTDNSADFHWNYGNDADSYTPLQFKIEEHIEEITTHHLTDEETSNSSYVNDSDSDPCLPNTKEKRKSYLISSQRGSYGSSTFKKKHFSSMLSSDESSEALQHFDLPSISGDDITGAKRVPFPELGVDLLQGSTATTTDGGPIEVLLDNTNWKENWLFMKERNKLARDVQTSETITMLIPNPSSNINPTIGDRDVDELSELSDRHSNYSFDTSSDDEYGGQNCLSTKLATVASKDLVDLVGEISAEFGQQDQEYTEDISKLEKLQFNNTISRSINHTNGNDINFNNNYNNNERERILSKEDGAEEITGVTPVIKSRKFKSLEKNKISFNSDTYSRNSKIVKKIQKSKVGKPISILLSPPEGVPQEVGENLQTSSPSVWFESTPEGQSVPAGRVLRLTCQVHSRDICGVSWYFKNELLKEGKNVLMWKKGDTYHLNVFEMDKKKTGPYFVAAYTKDDSVWGRCFVSCTEQGRVNKIPRITLTIPEVIVENGSDIVLECQVGGHPEPKVSFIKNSTPLNNQYPNCFVENDQYGTWALHLKKASEASSGQIKVIASNALGHAMSFFNVKVIPEGQNANVCAEKLQNSKSTPKVKKPNHEATATKTKTTKPSTSAKRTNENYSHNDSINNHNGNNSSNAELESCSSTYNDNASNLSETIASNINNEITVYGCMFQPPKPGTIAEREHRKWLEAKPLPNNPYSPEKLASRIGRSPSRFPSLPTVCRENSGDEFDDPSLRESLLSSASDLTRYSRDYHINNTGIKKKTPYHNYREVNESFEQIKKSNQSSSTPKCLVKLESRVAENWKEELKDIKLDVGKKVADIQKTIDAYQHEWEKQMRQRSSNSSDNRLYSLQRGSPKLSASCFNLTSPVKSKSSVPSSSNSGSRNRHLVYSSTETLNRDQSKNNLWRTVSVDTLNPPFKYSFPSLPPNHKPSEKDHSSCKETEVSSSKETLPKRYSSNLLSDSDDSSNLNTPYYVKNHSYSGQCREEASTVPFAHQNGYSSKRMTSYCSENSIESLKEESDTEESLFSCADDSNMPSVKELACKFDSLKNTKKKSSEVRKHHENLRPSRNRNVPTSPSYNTNININNSNSSSRKYNDRVIVNEVRIGGKPTKIYGKNINTDYPRLPYRFEGFKEIGSESTKEESLSPSPRLDKPLTSTSSSDVFTPTERVSNHFTFDDFHHKKYRNRFSTSELNKADEFWGSYGTSNLQRMKTLNISNSSSIAESDISVVTLPAIPDSSSRDANDLFGIKLRKGDFLSDKNKHGSGSSSDIFPLSKINRPKSMPDFRVIQDLSDEEPDALNKHDPVIARIHNLPKFHANITRKEEKNYKTSISISLHNVSANREPQKYEGKNYGSSTNFGTFTRNKKNGTRMYDFIRKYENKKSLKEIPSYVQHDESKSEDRNETTLIESDVENQVKQAADVDFNVPLKPKFKKRGSMQDFLKMYSNKTTLSPIPNSEETEVIPNVKISNSDENLENQFDFSTKQNENSVNFSIKSKNNEQKTTYTSKESVQVTNNKNNSAFIASDIPKFYEKVHSSEGLKAQSIETVSNYISKSSEQVNDNKKIRESNKSDISNNYEKILANENSSPQTTEVIFTDKSEHEFPQVGTFGNDSFSKPKVKPKPDFLSSSKITIEEKTANAILDDTVDSTKAISMPPRLPKNFVEIKPEYRGQKYNFKVSKYHIIPKISQISDDETTMKRSTLNLIKNDDRFLAAEVERNKEIKDNSNDKINGRLQNFRTVISNTRDDELHGVRNPIDDKSGERTQYMSLSTNYKTQENTDFNDARKVVIHHVNSRNDEKFEDKSRHVSTLIYGSMNKPITKPKPNLLTSSKKPNENEIKIEEHSENLINMSRHSNNTVQIDSDSSVPDDKIRVSKYHITTKNIYRQYLHNYSNIKSLKEIRNQRDDSENIRISQTNLIDTNIGETFHTFTKDYKEIESSDNNSNDKCTEPKLKQSKLDLVISTTKESCEGIFHDTVSQNKTYSKNCVNDIVDTTKTKGSESTLNFKGNTKSEEENQLLNPDLNFRHSNIPVLENININKISKVQNKENNATLSGSIKADKLINDDEILMPTDLKTFIPSNNEVNINETLISHEENYSSNKPENIEELNKENQSSACISKNVSETDSMCQFTSEVIENDLKFSINEASTENFLPNTRNEETRHKNSTTDKAKIEPLNNKNISAVKPNNILVANSKQKETLTEVDAHIKELKEVLSVKTPESDAESSLAHYFKTKSKPATPPVIDDDDTDPLSLTKRIVRGARCGSSGLSAVNKYNKPVANLPEKSPFVYKQRKFEDMPE